MALSVGEIVVALTAGTDQFHRGLNTVSDLLRQFSRDNEQQVTALGSAFKALALSVGAVAGAGVALFASVNAAVQSVGALNDEVAQLGVSAEEFQRLAFAAKDFGVEQGELRAALRIFTRNVGQAISAADGAQTIFDKLGISLNGVGGRAKTNQELILEFANALRERVPNAQQRAAFAVEAFGRSGGQLVPLLSQGSAGLKEFGDEAERLGFVLSNSTIANADAAAEAFDRLTGAFAIQLKGALVELAPTLLDIAADIFPRLIGVAQLAVDAFNGLKVLFVGLGGVVATLARAFITLLNALFDLAEFSAGGLKSLALLLRGDFVGAAQEAEAAQAGFLTHIGERLTELKENFADTAGAVGLALDEVTQNTAGADAVLAKLATTFSALGATARKSAAAIRSGAAAAQAAGQQNAGTGGKLETTSTEGAAALKRAEEDRIDRLAKMKGPLLEQAVALQRQVDQLRKQQLSDADRVKANALIRDLLLEQTALMRRQEEASEGFAAAFANLQEQIGEFAQIDPRAAGEFANEVGQRLAAAREQGAEAQQQAVAELARDLAQKLEEARPAVASAVGSGIAAGVQEGLAGGNGLESFARSLQQVGQDSLTRAFTRAADELGKALKDILPGSVSGLTGILTGIFGSVLGAAFNRTEVQSAAGNIQSAVTSAQQVRGIVAGPSSIAIAQVGESIRDAFRESERLLGLIARNTGAIAGATLRAPAGEAIGVSESAWSLANESAALT